jgi:hypothetical protein
VSERGREIIDGMIKSCSEHEVGETRGEGMNEGLGEGFESEVSERRRKEEGNRQPVDFTKYDMAGR